MKLIINNLLQEFEAIQEKSADVTKRLKIAMRLADSNLSPEQQHEAYYASIGANPALQGRLTPPQQTAPQVVRALVKVAKETPASKKESSRKKFTRKSVTAAVRDKVYAFYAENKDMTVAEACKVLEISAPTFRKILAGDYDGVAPERISATVEAPFVPEEA